MPTIPGAMTLRNAGAPTAGVNEVQLLTYTATTGTAVADSGTFIIIFEGFRTSALAFDASAAVVQAALRALPSIGALGCTVTVAAGPPRVYTVTFGGGNMTSLALPLMSIETSLLEGANVVDVIVTESVEGVTATGRGALTGAVLLDTTNGDLYINNGTPLAPVWGKVPDGVTATAAVINAAVAGVAAGYKIARGMHTTVAAADTVVTGLTTVVAAVAVLDADPTTDPLFVTCSIGNQAGAPAAGSIYIKGWKPTAVNDVTPVAATTFTKKVAWIAVGV